jgi:hypothetical protein
MQPKERKIISQSLGIGAIAGLSVWFWCSVQAEGAKPELRRAIKQCEQVVARDAARGVTASVDLTLICRKYSDESPNILNINDPKDLSDAQGAVSDARYNISSYRSDGTLYGGMVFVLFCLPLVWYFLMDRLREIGAALSGRDRQP